MPAGDLKRLVDLINAVLGGRPLPTVKSSKWRLFFFFEREGESESVPKGVQPSGPRLKLHACANCLGEPSETPKWRLQGRFHEAERAGHQLTVSRSVPAIEIWLTFARALTPLRLSSEFL